MAYSNIFKSPTVQWSSSVETHIRSISYKPNISFKTWTADNFIAVQLHEKLAVDTETGEEIEMFGHITYIPMHADKETVIREVYYLCMRWEMHELQEFFKVDGKRPFNPHHSLEDLMQL